MNDFVFVCSCRREAICLWHVWYEVYPALPPGEAQACPQWGEALPVWEMRTGLSTPTLHCAWLQKVLFWGLSPKPPVSASNVFYYYQMIFLLFSTNNVILFWRTSRGRTGCCGIGDCAKVAAWPRWRVSRAVSPAHTLKSPRRHRPPGAPCTHLLAGWPSDIPPPLHPPWRQRRDIHRVSSLQLCVAWRHTSSTGWSHSSSPGNTNDRGTNSVFYYNFCFLGFVDFIFFVVVLFSPCVFLSFFFLRQDFSVINSCPVLYFIFLIFATKKTSFYCSNISASGGTRKRAVGYCLSWHTSNKMGSCWWRDMFEQLSNFFLLRLFWPHKVANIGRTWEKPKPCSR